MTTIQKTTKTQVTKTTKTETCTSPQVTITKKGGFFNDSFFEDRRQDYQVAVKDVLSKFGDKTSKTDELTSYRNLRTKDLREENQAVRSTQDERVHKIVIDVQDFVVGGEVNVKTVDEQKVVIEGHVQRQEGNTTSSKSFKKTFIFSDAEMESITSVMSSDGILTVTIPKKQQEIQQITNIQKVTTVTQQQQQQQQQQIQNTNTSVQEGNKTLCITQRGNFFDDSIFEDARKPFQEAIQQVLQKSNITTSQTDQITSYRDLRQRELKDETQAATTSDDQNQHKIIVDVQDFINGGQVTVKTVDDREVVIEGSIKKQEGNKTSSKSFRKRYVLPEDIQTEEVTSVVSSDGVLTIIAPKKPQALLPGQVNVPLAIQQTDTNKQAVASNITNTALQTTDQKTTQSQVASQDTQQQNVTVQKKVTTVTQQSTTTTDSSTCSSPTDRSLTITKKGEFFNDSFFEDARQPFQEAVRNVLQKSNVTTTQTNEIQSYRDLRQKELKDETQAATTSDDQKQHKIIVDVQDFVNGDIKVKTVDDREVVIEGTIKKQEGNKTSSKSFRKRYVLPDDIQTESVTSVMSSDGVLTIIAPKKPESIQPKESTVAIQNSNTTKQVVSTDTKNTALQSVSQTTNTQSDVATQQAQQENVVVQKKVTTVTQQSNVTTDSSTCSTPTDNRMIITKKGDFFDDSFFEDARKPFQEAVRNVLQKSNVTTTQTNEIQSYRDLRQKELKDETQAATTSDDQNQHKIIVDVQDFINGGEVVVKTVDEREVVIEGSVKRQEGNTTSSKSFRKRYVLPQDILTEKVTSVVSSDGILTIIAPKKPQAIQPGEFSVPLALQDSNVKQQEVAIDTTNSALQSISQEKKTESEVATQQTQQQQNVTVQKKVTTITQQSNVTTDGSTCSTPTDNRMPITKKGDFFNDSFFEDARKPFQDAVRNVLQKSNVTTTQTNEIQSYRDLRQKELKEETQAATTSDDQNQHKIIVDVQDFINGGEVVVKTVDEREVVIEGSVKRQEGNTTSSKSFRKRYVLPQDILTEKVTSVVSSDGILTIIAPKKPQAIQPGEVCEPLALQDTNAKQQLVATDTTNSALQSITQEKKTQSEVATQQTQQQQDVTIQKKVTTVTQQSNVTTDSSTCSTPTANCMPITKKGDFFNDSFFEDARKPFQEAVRNVLQKSNVTTTQTNEIQSYRDLRQKELKEETQAATTSDDQNQHKIIVDVQDFINGGEVVVKTVDEREVVIEGSVKRQEGNTTSSKSFRKRYVLPQDILTEKVTSVVSSDGILTIIAPKKPQAILPGESSVPLSIQDSNVNRQVVTKDTSNTALQSVSQETNTQREVATQQTQQQQNVVVQKKVTKVTQQSNVTTDSSTCDTPTDSRMTLIKKGDFFSDDFFEDARKPFQEAIKSVLQKSNVTTTQTNDIQSYRNLRQRELKEETQAATISDDQKQHKIIVDVQDFIVGGEVVVKTVDEREVVIEGSVKKQEGNTTSSKSFRKRYVLPEDIQTDKVTSVVSADGVLTIIAPKKPRAIQPGEANVPLAIQQPDMSKQVVTADSTNKSLQSVSQTTNTQSEVASQQTQQQNVVVQKKVTTVTQQSNITTDSSTCSSPTDKSLTITKKGDFFSDSIFEDARKPFQEAIRNVLQKSNVTTTQTNEIQSYRDLRQRELKDETQAAITSDDQNRHKIIVDVQDFINGGEVIVKTIDDREVVIEGSIKKQEGNKTSSKSFRRRYILPEDIQTESVTSVVSSDGVLTIIAPKKGA